MSNRTVASFDRTFQSEFRGRVRSVWQALAGSPVPAAFSNVEGGSIEQQHDQRLRLHHCANYAAVWCVLADRGPRLSILELGCGTGALSCAFARLMPAGWRLTATDYSPKLVEHACRHYPGENLCFEQLDARSLRPGQLAGFDVVLLLEVIEHMSGAEAAALLNRLYQGLPAGASLVISTLDRAPFSRPFSGYAPHRVEYTCRSLSRFLADRRHNPFDRVRVYRLLSPRIAREAVRSERFGGYLANRLQGLALGVGRRSPALGRLHALAMALFFRLYTLLPRRDAFDLDGYLASLELVGDDTETRGGDSFGLVAVLEKG